MTDIDVENDVDARCPCGLDGTPPWRSSGPPWGPLSVFCAVIVVGGFALAVVLVGVEPWLGWVLFGVLGAAVLVGLVIEAVGGHRRACLVGRGTWKGLCLPGLPVRLLLSVWWI